MFKKRSLIALVSGTLLTSNIAYASFTDGLVGGVVGGVVGSVITNEVYHKKNKPQKRYRTVKKRHVAPAIRHNTSEMKIQKSLKALGFYRGQIDGEVNSYETRSAIRSMNMAYNLGNNASLSLNSKDALIYLGNLFTFDRILISNNNTRRAKGKKIQAALKIHGFYFDKIDGVIGAGTRRNILDYKRAKGLYGGANLGFEEEYQLISTAKQMNDKNIDTTINSLKGTHVKVLNNNVQPINNQQNRPVKEEYEKKEMTPAT